MQENPVKRAVIIFQKIAIAGKVKTRVAKTIGDEAALDIYKKLVLYTHDVASEITGDKIIYFSDFQLNKTQETTPDQFQVQFQSGNNLGQKMANAFAEVLAKGYEKVLLIGTDCGVLTSDLLDRGFEILDEKDLVIGPAQDGGYYLIGMKISRPEIFENIPWSSEEVLSLTVKRVESEGLTYGLLPVLSDVDTYEDWKQQEEFVLKRLSKP
ncbi:TIGR04282 family arsenosugar biosynthesis glycosyltransferase [Algoriphagus sediminis]|uniref:TIGR04282 family arsenosugar biosynthesis glycosyltransferase n=1 Tax=Algoriphagus sediminis TaxID=3057113 RepID=A0ABT7YD99_9BACT|nr:TIGR04282 family arsenosugar biosynthesis glycosyltransferase [Algoriphagus sediminis]MDN3204499.1 TIGR04282 family arsenosugar biosynthesis glycosyltransferase [Algoriphagus sediminis]